MFVVPGLIDAHAHVLPGLPFTYPISEIWKRGIVSLIDLGSNAAGPFNRLRQQYIDDAPLPVNVALGLSCLTDCRGGIPRYSDLEHEVNKEQIKEVFEANPDCLVGMKALIGHNDSPGRELTLSVMEKAREVCDYVGCRNWSSEVARAAFDQGFIPDIISDDLTCLSNDPYTSRLHVHMGECVAMGMPVEDVLKKVTSEPAKLMNNVQTGIQKGLAANITVLEIDEGEHEFIDAFGLKYSGPVRFTPKATIFRGQIKYDAIQSDY